MALLPNKSRMKFSSRDFGHFRPESNNSVVSDAMGKHPAGEESDGRAEAPRFEVFFLKGGIPTSENEVPRIPTDDE